MTVIMKEIKAKCINNSNLPENQITLHFAFKIYQIREDEM